jgi:HAD superfamily hydrolase (TIGR01509 family)
MAAPRVRAIIFDIGRVLIRIDPARAAEGLAKGGSSSPSELWTAIEKDPRWPDWQEGRISPRDWYLHLARRFGRDLTFEQFTEAWNRVLDPTPIHEDALFENLSKSYLLAVLSNTDPIHVRHLEATYSFFRFFPTRIYSCRVAASKPNPLIYREALRALKVQAPEAVYIDDIPAYVDAAQRLGMGGIHFRSPAQLSADLRSLGVVLP